MCLRVAEAAGFDEDDCYRIGMAVREGVINAFHYGNQERPEKKIYLEVELTPNEVVIHVLDEGKGFNLEDVPNPLAEENLLSTSGRGIFLMRIVHGRVRCGAWPDRRSGNYHVEKAAWSSAEVRHGKQGKGRLRARRRGKPKKGHMAYCRQHTGMPAP